MDKTITKKTLYADKEMLLMYLLAVGMLFFDVISQELVVSVLFKISFIVLFLLWIKYLICDFNNIDWLCIYILVFSCSNVLINFFNVGGTFSFDYFKKLIMFCSTIIFFSICFKIKIKPFTKKIILNTSMLFALFLVFAYFIGGDNMYIFDGKVSDYLLFNLDNPNGTGLFLTLLSFYCILFGLHFNKLILKICSVASLGFLMYFILETKSRNSLLALLVCLAMLILFMVYFDYSKKERKKVPDLVILAVVIFPIAFVFLYLVLLNSTWFCEAFSFLVDTGKGLNSREAVWLESLGYFIASPFFGAYNEVLTKIEYIQLHNSHLEVITSYGILPFVLLCYFLYEIIYKVNEQSDNETNKYMIFFLSVIFLGLGEAILFSGGMGFYILAGILLLFTKKDLKNQEMCDFEINIDSFSNLL